MTYDYACRACGHEWEVEHKVSENPVKGCPTCASQDVYRCCGSTGFQLVGAGWAATGYAKGSQKR